jgi:hypothetical protein
MVPLDGSRNVACDARICCGREQVERHALDLVEMHDFRSPPPPSRGHRRRIALGYAVAGAADRATLIELEMEPEAAINAERSVRSPYATKTAEREPRFRAGCLMVDPGYRARPVRSRQ